MRKLFIEEKEISALHCYANNAKNHTDTQVSQIINSIKKFGFNNPILIDDSGEIIAGHGRYAAATIMGLEKVPVITLSHLTEDQKKAYRLSDNKISENGGGWNKKLLQLEIKDLEKIYTNDLTLHIPGFTISELTPIVTNTSKSKNTFCFLPNISNIKPVTKNLDIWLLGKHKIICGTNTNKNIFSNLFTDQKADLILQTIDTSAKNIFSLSQNFNLCKEYSNANCLYYNFCDHAHISDIINTGNIFDKLTNICIWVKDNTEPCTLYKNKYDVCLIFQNGNKLNINQTKRTNIWNYPTVKTQKQYSTKLSLKPINMLCDIISETTNATEIVLDTFLGCGDTLIACQNIGRTCYAIESNPLYVDISIQRFQKLFNTEAVNLKTGKTYNQLIKVEGL